MLSLRTQPKLFTARSPKLSTNFSMPLVRSNHKTLYKMNFHQSPKSFQATKETKDLVDREITEKPQSLVS